MHIGLRIKSYRQEAQITQKELANKLNVDQTTISSWETGRTEPCIGQADEIANALGITKQKLLGVEITEDVTEVENIMKNMDENMLRRIKAYADYLLSFRSTQ